MQLHSIKVLHCKGKNEVTKPHLNLSSKQAVTKNKASAHCEFNAARSNTIKATGFIWSALESLVIVCLCRNKAAHVGGFVDGDGQIISFSLPAVEQHPFLFRPLFILLHFLQNIVKLSKAQTHKVLFYAIADLLPLNLFHNKFIK